MYVLICMIWYVWTWFDLIGMLWYNLICMIWYMNLCVWFCDLICIDMLHADLIGFIVVWLDNVWFNMNNWSYVWFNKYEWLAIIWYDMLDLIGNSMISYVGSWLDMYDLVCSYD